MLKSCDGVANIADDIIVFGTNASEHNARLHTVLNKLQEFGLTLNRDKCRFGLSKLTFFGHDLSSTGIKANEEKVQAIQNASHFKTKRKQDHLWAWSSVRQSLFQIWQQLEGP